MGHNYKTAMCCLVGWQSTVRMYSLHENAEINSLACDKYESTRDRGPVLKGPSRVKKAHFIGRLVTSLDSEDWGRAGQIPAMWNWFWQLNWCHLQLCGLHSHCTGYVACALLPTAPYSYVCATRRAPLWTSAVERVQTLRCLYACVVLWICNVSPQLTTP
jgi:hypothetical protein